MEYIGKATTLRDELLALAAEITALIATAEAAGRDMNAVDIGTIGAKAAAHVVNFRAVNGMAHGKG